MVLWTNLLKKRRGLADLKDKDKFKNSAGFTLVELIVVVTMTIMLTSIILVNFRPLREQQEINLATQDMISKIREVQNYVLSGRTLPVVDEAARSYQIIFTSDFSSYAINYVISTGTTTLEVVNLPQNMKVQQVFLGVTPKANISVRIESPFGKISVDGVSSQVGEIRLVQTSSGRTKTITIDPISGRIERKNP